MPFIVGIAVIIATGTLLVLLHQQDPRFWGILSPQPRAEENNSSKATIFWGGFSAYLSLMVAVVRAPAWFLVLSGICLFVAFWPVAKGWARTGYMFISLLALGFIGIGSLQIYIYQVTKSRIECSIALIPTIHKMRDPAGGYMRGGQNDLIGILRVRTRNGLSVRHVNSIRVIGDVSADFGTCQSTFSKNDGTESQEYLDNQFTTMKPFFHLSWVVHPDSHNKIDPVDEEFIPVTISSSMGAIQVISKDIFGFASTGQGPKYPTTTPTWSQLVEFAANNPTLGEGMHPRLRNEVRTGQVKIQIDLDGEIIDIPVQNIRFPWATSLRDGLQARSLPENLFYGIDNDGSLNTLPSSANPLIEEERSF